MNEKRKPPATLYEWMRDRYLDRLAAKKASEQSKESPKETKERTP
jgi:hypothetical protein